MLDPGWLRLDTVLLIDIPEFQKEVRIVQASLLGSILANLLLILGMCLVFGGLRFREQVSLKILLDGWKIDYNALSCTILPSLK